MKLVRTACKKAALFSIITAMMVSSFNVHAAYFTDTAGRWANNVIERWAQYQILRGFEYGTLRPDEAITKAQAIFGKPLYFMLTDSDG